MPRNPRADQIGTGGRIKSESPGGCARNAQPTRVQTNLIACITGKGGLRLLSDPCNNARLEEQCLKRQDEVLRGHSETIGERLMRDLDALMTLPLTPYDACGKVSTRATSISMVRYRNNDYSVPVAYAHHEV